MARIFAFSEIQDNQVPEFSTFDKVKSSVIRDLTVFHEAGVLFGARIFGSLESGAYSRQSDCDLLIMLDGGINDIVMMRQILQKYFTSVQTAYNIRIEPTFVGKNLAMHGVHLEDPAFVSYLRRSLPGNIIGNDPLEYLIESQLCTSSEDRLLAYLQNKLHRFSEMLASGDTVSDRLHLLQRALELPANLGRNVLRAFQPLAQERGVIIYDEADPRADSKQYAVEHFRQFHAIFCPTETNLLADFEFLVAAGNMYTSVLSHILEAINIERIRIDQEKIAMQGEPDLIERVEAGYQKFLLAIEQEYTPLLQQLDRECIVRAFYWIAHMRVVVGKLLKDT